MKVLGVTDHRFLGGFGRFHDSGMAWHEDGHAIAAETIPDNAFWTTDLIEAADELVKVIREVRPQVLVTYDQFGGYGHPDHIQAHRVAMYAAQLAAAPSYRLDLGEPHDIAKIYWTAMSESRMRESLRKLRESGDTETFKGMEPDGKLPPFVTPDELISARVDGTATVERKMDALASTPPRSSRTATSSPAPRAATRGGPTSTTAWSRAPPAPPAPTGSRRTSSPGCEAAVMALLAGVVGLLSGAAGTLLHQQWWGLALALVAGIATLGWLPPGVVRLAFAVGWCLAVVRGAIERPAGGFLIASDAAGWSWLAASFVLLLAALATAPQRRRGAPRIREFEDSLPRLAAWRRTPRALASSPATRPAPRSSCGSCSASWCSSAGSTSPPTTSPATRSRATRRSPASASAGTRRPRPPSGSRRAWPTRSPATIATTIDGQPVAIAPAEAGLSVDYDASVAEAGGEESWDPVRLWNYFTGGDAFEAEVTVDDTAFQAYLAGLDEQHGATARDGAVAFDGARVVTKKARTGAALDPADTLAALRTAFLEDEPGEVALEMTDVVPAIDASDVEETLDTFASPAVAAPVTLSFEGSNVKVFPADYTAALSLVPTDGELVPTLDAAKLAEVVGAKVTQGAPVDATVTLVDGTPQVVPAKPGVTFDEQQLEAGFLEAVAKPQGERTLALTAKVAQPAFTTKDARALRISEQVSTFTTYFPYAEYRNVNLGRAAELIDGTVLKPGETFSLNGTVGERTEANGFTKGYIISDGILVQDLGGGVSQIATTTFNAMFFAGLEDVEHKPHSFYIDRYPIGREATVAWGAVDLQFRNDTPYGVLIEANVTPSTPTTSGVATVSMYSTKYWDITTTDGRALQPHPGEDAPDRRPEVPRQRGLRRLRHRRRALLHARQRQHRDPRRRGLQHDLHAQRHGHLHQPRRRRRVAADGAGTVTASAGAGRAGRA